MLSGKRDFLTLDTTSWPLSVLLSPLLILSGQQGKCVRKMEISTILLCHGERENQKYNSFKCSQFSLLEGGSADPVLPWHPPGAPWHLPGALPAPFSSQLGLGGCDGAVEPAQPCCSALLCAVPRHLQTSCNPSRISKHLSQTSNKQQKVLLWGSLGEGEKLWGATTVYHAVFCLKHCLVEQGQFSGSISQPPAEIWHRSPLFSPLVASFSGTGALGEVQPHRWIQTHQSPLVMCCCFLLHLGLQAMPSGIEAS